MSSLRQSVEKLTNSVENLEASLQLLEEAQATSKAPESAQEGQQHDMFPTGTGDAVAVRVEKAIQNVETLLGES